MDTLPRYIIPVGLTAQIIKNLPAAATARVLPSVDDLKALTEAIKAYPVSVAIIGPEWPKKDMAHTQELLFDHAVACIFATDLAPGILSSAIHVALEKRSCLADSPFFAQLLELLPDIVYFKDRCGRFLAANQVLARRFKLENPAVMIGRSDFDFLATEYAQQTLADEQEVIRTGQPVTAMLEKATDEENRTSWWLTWKAPLRDQTGRVIGTYGFSRDQTELKNTEIALTSERHLLEALLTGLPDFVFIKDNEGRFLIANQILAKWLGGNLASPRGKCDADIYPPELAAACRKDEEQVMATGMPVINREEVVRTRDGRELFLLTTRLPYRNPEGKIIGIIGMSRNVTLRKGFDDQMKLAQSEIAALRAEVTQLKASAGGHVYGS